MVLLVAREFLERALSVARSRADERLIGERICEVMQMQELQEQRTIAEVEAAGCPHRDTTGHRRGEVTPAGVRVASECVDCGVTVFVIMPKDWDGTIVIWNRRARRPKPKRITI